MQADSTGAHASGRADGLPHGRAYDSWGAPAQTARVAVLAVHGRGQGAEDLRALTQRIGRNDVHYLAPVADDATWYPLSFLAPLDDNQPHLDGAVAAVEAGIDRLEHEGFSADRIVLLGFSQGACLLSHCVLTAPVRFAGAALLTGGYPGPDEAAPPRPAPALAGIPVVMSLGTEDPWVPFDRAERTRDLLVESGADVTFLPFPGADHVVSDEAIEAVRALVDSIGRA